MFAETRLENGIRVISESLPQTRALALGILIEAGPQNEPVDKAGIAHLAEHLFFQGTSSRSARDIALFMDRSGGNFGAFTSRDYTFFGASILDDHLPYALELFGDILLNAIFPAVSIEREKQSILAELAHAEDDPQSRAQDLLKGYIWGNHPLGRPIAGTATSVANLTREDLIYFVHENYLPDRMIITAAGSLCHEDLTAQARDAFWRMIGKSAHPRPRQEFSFRAGVKLENKPLNQMYFAYAIPAIAYDHPDRLALHLIAKILGKGLSSRLYRQLREKFGLVYYIDADYHAYRDAGLLIIEGSTPPDSFKQVVTFICRELSDLATGAKPIEEEELNTAQMSLRGRHLLESENTYVQMSRLATQTLYFDRHIETEAILEGIMSSSVDSLNLFAQQYLATNIKHGALSGVGPCSGKNIHREEIRGWLNQELG